MRPLLSVAAAVAVAFAPSARADAPVAPAPRGVVIAVAPIAALAGPQATGLEPLLEQQLGAIEGFTVVTAAQVRQAVKRARRGELATCEGDVPCLAALGKLMGADRVVSGEVGALGEGQIAYLKAVDVATGKEVGSTTAVFTDPAQRAAETRAAAYRMLLPTKYMGTIDVTVDIPGAKIYIDGRWMGSSPARPMLATVGTHALRVTHEQYRDWVRFVDVGFDETAKLAVNLSAYPVLTDEMHRHRAALGRKADDGARPWYRTWWAVAGAGTVALVGTLLIVDAFRSGVDRDVDLTVNPP